MVLVTRFCPYTDAVALALAVFSNCLVSTTVGLTASEATTGAALLTALLLLYPVLPLLLRCSEVSRCNTTGLLSLSSALPDEDRAINGPMLLLLLVRSVVDGTSPWLLLLLVVRIARAAAAKVLLYAPLPLPLIVLRMLRPAGVSMRMSKPFVRVIAAATSGSGAGK